MTMLLSLQVFAITTEIRVLDNDSVSVEIEKGEPDKKDTHPRTLIPIACIYTDGMVQLSLLAEIGDFTLTVTNQLTGEKWSAENALILQASTAIGTYLVQTVTEDGSFYYGTYTL